MGPDVGRTRGKSPHPPPEMQSIDITISLKKQELGKEISFTGHIVSQSGIRPDDSKYRAIAEFTTPENVLN